MREALDMMAFVDAVYLLTSITTLGLISWSWLAMARAERSRDEARRS